MTHCLCFEPSSRMEWADIGMTDGYWDIASMRWGICGTQRLRAFQEIEAFSRSGRHYRTSTTDKELTSITSEAALHIIEVTKFRIAAAATSMVLSA